MNDKKVLRKYWLIEALIVVLAVAVDQLSKYFAHIYLAPLDSVSILKGVVSLRYIQNEGAAFGMLQGQRWFFFIITVPVMIAIIYVLIKKRPNKTISIALALILGGAIGNFIDRVAFTYVRDFILFEFSFFPYIFNIADSCVTVGGVILVAKLLFGRQPVFLNGKTGGQSDNG